MTGDDAETTEADRPASDADSSVTDGDRPASDGDDSTTDGDRPATDGPARLSNRQLFTVATAFTVAVVALGVAGAAVPRYSRTLGLVVLGCIAAYGAFGLAIVYRAGQRL